jgi:hypothetical protein
MMMVACIAEIIYSPHPPFPSSTSLNRPMNFGLIFVDDSGGLGDKKIVY